MQEQEREQALVPVQERERERALVPVQEPVQVQEQVQEQEQEQEQEQALAHANRPAPKRDLAQAAAITQRHGIFAFDPGRSTSHRMTLATLHIRSTKS